LFCPTQLTCQKRPHLQNIADDFPDMRTNAGHSLARAQMKFDAAIHHGKKDGFGAAKAEVSPEIQSIIVEGEMKTSSRVAAPFFPARNHEGPMCSKSPSLSPVAPFAHALERAP
jgi:hypothetical protein